MKLGFLIFLNAIPPYLHYEDEIFNSKDYQPKLIFLFMKKIYNIHFRNANKHLYFNAGNSPKIEHGSALSLDHTLNFQFRVLFLLLYNDNCSIKIIESFAFSLLQ